MTIGVMNLKGKPRKKRFFLFPFLIIISLLIIFLDITFQVTILKNFIGYFIFPSQKKFSSFLHYSEKVGKNMKSFLMTFEENSRIKKELLHMQDMLTDYNLLILENKRLKKMLDFQEKRNMDMVLAEVVGRSPSDWYSSVIINKGEKHGVKEKDVVIAGAEPLPRLVGQVIESQYSFSKVLLLTDANSSVSGYLNYANIDGIIKGKDDKRLIMKFVDSAFTIEKGDVVISSGLGGIFPFGFYIGKVQSALPNVNEEFQDIIIKPAIESHRLREVFVIQKQESSLKDLNSN